LDDAYIYTTFKSFEIFYLYRGVGLPEEIIQNIKNSKFFTFNEFLSTSFSKDLALKFCKNCLIIINCGNNTLFRRDNTSCGYLEYHTAVKGEEEVLFPCGTTFKVISVEK
jgi:hypothetical protein